MRKTETVQVPATTEERVLGTTCDVCGATCPQPRKDKDGLDWWGERGMETARLFAYRANAADPTFNARHDMDICHGCARNLIALLRDDAALRERVKGGDK